MHADGDDGIVSAMKTIGERIKYIRESLGLSQEAFGARLKLSRGAVSNWESVGETSIKTENLLLIAQKFEVPLEWLANNEGDPPNLNRDNRVSRSAVRNLSSLLGNVESEEVTPLAAADFEFKGKIPGSIPEVDAKPGAGDGVYSGEQSVSTGDKGIVSGHRVVSEWLLPPEYLRHVLHTTPSRTWIMEVIGDSMAPTLAPGDRVMVDTAHKVINPDGVYVIDEGHGPMVKRLQLDRDSESPRVLVISDNAAHRPFTLSMDRFHVIGRVCGRFTRL